MPVPLHFQHNLLSLVAAVTGAVVVAEGTDPVPVAAAVAAAMAADAGTSVGAGNAATAAAAVVSVGPSAVGPRATTCASTRLRSSWTAFIAASTATWPVTRARYCFRVTRRANNLHAAAVALWGELPSVSRAAVSIAAVVRTLLCTQQ